MGSRLVQEYFETDESDPAVALQQCRVDHFQSLQLDLRATLCRLAESQENALEACRKAGDEYGLADHYATEAKHFRRLSMSKLPDSAEEQLEIFAAAVGRSSGEGCGNIFDFRGVTDDEQEFCFRLLTEPEIWELCGTDFPQVADIPTVVEVMWPDMHRAHGVCLRIFAADVPAGWCFIGATID
ncbi:MAG: hypothetical protein R3C49_18505 [Planctomycetaceae bacterium]